MSHTNEPYGPTNTTATTRRPRLIAALCAALGLILTGCGGDTVDASAEPAGFVPAVGSGTEPLAVVLLDTSASVLRDTDLVASAQNRVTTLVSQSPVGGTVVVKALNDVSANCTDLKLTLPEQANDTMLQQAREANKAAVAAAFPDYVDCVSAADPGGTQLLGLLAVALTDYPLAQTVDVYTDGIDTWHIKGLRKEANLRDPEFVDHALDSLPAALIPPMQPATTLTWHALGRGTGFDAVALSGLTQIYRRWTTLTGATAQFAPQ